jgi:ubiquinone/menaquinone biosynthesis C-methylase UbiE
MLASYFAEPGKNRKLPGNSIRPPPPSAAMSAEPPVPQNLQKGAVIHQAAGYDMLLWLLTFGRERRFRRKLLAFADLQPGQSVLDVGCGTGALAIAAKEVVGAAGLVAGVDASPQMIDRARLKAARAGLSIDFREASADALPFADASLDAVLSTVMLHHLPRAVRATAVSEMRRVLKPGGRTLLIDFAGTRNGKGPLLHFHRTGHVEPQVLEALVTDAGMRIVHSGPVGKWSLQYVLGER